MTKEMERNQKVAVLILGILALISSIGLTIITKDWVIIPVLLAIISGIGIGIALKTMWIKGVENVERI